VTKNRFQTFIPENPIIQSIINDNYKEFFIKTLKERKDFKYPPFCELATLEYRNRDQEKAKIFIEKIYKKLIENKQENIEIIL
jgi:primosomal protein N' (replication factor Y)